MGLGGKLYTEEPWHSGLRAIALGQLRFLGPTDYSESWPWYPGCLVDLLLMGS